MNSFEPYFVLPTTEVRWFQEGELPPSWLPWFEGCPGSWLDEPLRTDSYLIIRDTDGLGVKSRQGRLEIKQRQESWGILQLKNHVQGLVEHWIKWSFEITGGEDLPAGFERPESNWASVHKVRKLRRYQLKDDGQLLPLPEGVNPANLCEVELTKVWMGEQPWWSLAFEAPGDKQASRETLLAVSRQLLGLEGAPELGPSNSYAYPNWLARQRL
jgi:hypothetical protein